LRTQESLTPATFRLPHPRPSARLGDSLAAESKISCCRNTHAANWESTTLAPACAARPTASVDMPSWRRFELPRLI